MFWFWKSFSNEESLFYLLPPTTRIGWVTNSMAAKIADNEIEI